MALWKARVGSLNKELDLDCGIVEGKGWEISIKSSILDNSTVEGKGRKFK